MVIGIIVLDQIIKVLIRSTMYIGESLPVIKEVFHITYVQNRGGAFSILSGQGFILTVVPLAAIIFATWYMEKHLSEHWSLFLSLSLIIGGGIGNLIDRIFLGFVTDMIDFRFFPVFNIADIAVCVGAGFLILYTIIFSEDDAARKSGSGSGEPA